MPDEITVFYVEDDANNRLLIRRILMAEGFNVIEASNALDALQKLPQANPDIILMDINMPDIDGYTLTAQIKQMPGFGSVPIIALTANVMRGDRERTLQAGCDGYIQKPVDVDALPHQINKFIQDVKRG